MNKAWMGPLGIHVHNNKGLTFNNTLSAIQSGSNLYDLTIMGTGRGAGNVNTEALMLECVNQELHAGNPSILNVCREYLNH